MRASFRLRVLMSLLANWIRSKVDEEVSSLLDVTAED